jgi:hypothetical protein
MKYRHCVKACESIETLDEDLRALELWEAVLLQAIEDLHPKGRSFEIVMNGIEVRWLTDSFEMRRNKRNAAAWFGSSCEDAGSFLWICGLFALDADLVRAKVKNKDFKLTR